MTYEVIFSPLADADLQEAYTYIAEKLLNSAAAEKLLDEVEEVCAGIARHPKKHPLVQDEFLILREIRFANVSNYILFYIISKEKQSVHIIRFLHSRRDWQKLM